MSLITEWQARFSSAKQIQYTNPDNSPANTVDATRLAAAAADAAAEFRSVTGRTFDTTDANHVRAAVDGVTYFLLKRGASVDGDFVRRLREDWHRQLAGLADLAPVTTSLLTPSDPDLSGGPVRPDFDRESLGTLVPNPPSSQTRPFGWR